MNLNTGLAAFIRINSKWITDLNTKCRTVKFLEENTGEELTNSGYGHTTIGTIGNA